MASSSSLVIATSWSPYATVRRYAELVAAAATFAAAADLLIGMPSGPSPDRTPSTDTDRSSGTVLPAVARTATAAASQVVRSRPRREIGPGSTAVGRSYVVSSTSDVSAPRMIGSFTAMWTTSAPIVIQAIA